MILSLSWRQHSTGPGRALCYRAHALHCATERGGLMSRVDADGHMTAQGLQSDGADSRVRRTVLESLQCCDKVHCCLLLLRAGHQHPRCSSHR